MSRWAHIPPQALLPFEEMSPAAGDQRLGRLSDWRSIVMSIDATMLFVGPRGRSDGTRKLDVGMESQICEKCKNWCESAEHSLSSS